MGWGGVWVGWGEGGEDVGWGWDGEVHVGG